MRLIYSRINLRSEEQTLEMCQIQLERGNLHHQEGYLA